ncbi:tripartite motif-containing protein 2-like [Glandiceps talaboti]
MASASFSREQLDERFLQCPICLDRFRKPKILPCFHSFCQDCLVSICKSSRHSITCPLDRRNHKLPSHGISGLPDSYFLNDLMDFIDWGGEEALAEERRGRLCEGGCERGVRVYCVECGQFLCDICANSHRNIKATKTHKVISVEEYEATFHTKSPFIRPIVCPVHDGNQIKLYCGTCNIPICLECALYHHKQPEHEHIPLQEALSKRRSALWSLKKSMARKVGKLKTDMKEVDKLSRDIDRDLQTAEREVRATSRHLIDVIKKNEDTLLKQIRDRHFDESQEIQTRRENMEILSGKIDKSLSFAEVMLNQSNDIGFLCLEKQADEKMRELLHERADPPVQVSLKFSRNNKFASCITSDKLGVVTTSRDSQTWYRFRSIQTITEIEPTFRRRLSLLMKDRSSWKHQLSFPRSVAFTYDGDLVAVSSDDQRVYIFDNYGRCKSQYTLTSRVWSMPFKPYDVQITEKGEILVTERTNKSVICFRRDGTTTPFHFGESGLTKPLGMAFDNRRRVHVVDIPTQGQTENPSAISCFTYYGTRAGTFRYTERNSPDMLPQSPKFIAINSKNHIILPDYNGHKVLVYNSRGRFLYQFGSEGQGDGKFEHPSGVAVDTEDNIFVSSNHRVQMFTPRGSFICRVDGIEDELSKPRGIAISHSHPYRVAVADAGNDRIKIYQLLR